MSTPVSTKKHKRHDLVKHGWYGTPEYEAWSSMKSRCLNANATNYHLYGGRGIKVCGQWIESFESFITDIGPKPNPEYVLDRIDNCGHYEPNNVRWTDKRTSANNRRVTLQFSHKGETLPLSEWAKRLGIPYGLLCDRVTRYGWSFKDAIFAPTQKKNLPIEWNGERKSLAEWARTMKIRYDTLRRAKNEGRWPSNLYAPRISSATQQRTTEK